MENGLNPDACPKCIKKRECMYIKKSVLNLMIR